MQDSRDRIQNYDVTAHQTSSSFCDLSFRANNYSHSQKHCAPASRAALTTNVINQQSSPLQSQANTQLTIEQPKSDHSFQKIPNSPHICTDIQTAKQPNRPNFSETEISNAT
ncbi:Uncharacterised protein [BD1-7 clade bacterium]|uniref:Uncharacterized protein n=1 Tax=BD1-7 clade bacterium TaxID=2029982 RepID=A0A5S9PK08_9GAMM|nr:Uncharacterised protein [BD1-7 clade bacterium]